MRELDFVRALTFDCYGTLVDWRRGVREAARAIPSLEGAELERLLRDRERFDAQLVRGPFRLYGELLAESLVLAAREQRLEVPQNEARDFAATMGDWPPFDETSSALTRLASRYRLAIVSNVETRVLERSIERLRAPIELFVSAEQVRSYKPAPAHFVEVARRLDLEPRRVLHVSISRFYDLVPARELGFKTAWIAREPEIWPRGEAPDVEARDLTELCARLGA